MVDISVIVPVYNAKNTLEKCVTGLLRQTFEKFELILINDCSSDNSLEICKELANKDSRVKVVRLTKNRGVAAARNVGLKHATGNYIAFVDSDDEVDHDFLKNLLITISKNDADLACCGYQDSTGRKMKRIVKIDKYLEILQNYQGFLCNKLYRRSIIVKNKLKLDTKITMCEDLLFNFEYLKYCNKVAYSNKNYYHYNIDQNSASMKNRIGWFDILTVYQKLTSGPSLYPADVKEVLFLKYLYALMEAKMRCRMMKLDFNKVCIDRGINSTKILKDNYRKIMQSRGINHKDKLRLFVFRRFNFLSQLIKFRRVYAV